MNGLLTITKDGCIAIISINNPPVNALSPDVSDGIGEAIAAIQHENAIKGVILIGAGQTFIAGADIKEFVKITSGQRREEINFLDLLRAIEDSTKPVVAAIHGTAFGGGLEVAMACHYRIAVASAQVGQPEVNLGLIPGAAGTQRLPRLAGVAKAVEMCAFGAPIRAQEAFALGIIDRIIEGYLLEGAKAFLRAKIDSGEIPPRTRERDQKLGNQVANAPIFAAAREQAHKAKRGMMAPLAAIAAVEAATTLSFDEGCRREAELFKECLFSDQSKALIHVFFGEREVSKIPSITKDTKTYEINRAAIIGTGATGTDIAMCYADAGIPVLIKDSSQEALDGGVATIRKNYVDLVNQGRFNQEAMNRRLSLIQPVLSYNDFAEVDIIIEAISEEIALKRKVFAELDKVCKPTAILASSTSVLDIDEIASATARPEMIIGHHFFPPANVTRLLEIVRGRITNNEVIATSMALAKKLKKIGVLVGNCPGFVGDRMFERYIREAQILVEEEVPPHKVDSALYEFGMKIGPLAMCNLDNLNSGRLKKASTIAIAPEEIVERTIYALINEGAKILAEGNALRATDIDIIYINAYGFPAWRGGPMWYADTVGLSRIYDRVCEFHLAFGELWEPAPLLKELTKAGKKFADVDQTKIHNHKKVLSSQKE